MTTYPVTMQLNHPHEVARWRPLVQWALSIPHFVVAHFLSSVAQALTLISWVVILFTGKLPRGIADFQAMAMRYESRVFSYAFFLREAYPTFDFMASQEDPGGDPLVVQIPAQLEDRNKLSVALRIFFVIPLLVVSILWVFVGLFVSLAGFFAVLFTGRWPESMRRTSISVQQWSIRMQAYCMLLRDDYPPFGLAD